MTTKHMSEILLSAAVSDLEIAIETIVDVKNLYSLDCRDILRDLRLVQDQIKAKAAYAAIRYGADRVIRDVDSDD